MGTPVNAKRSPDVRIIDGGSVILFALLTPGGHDWVASHVSEDGQMLGIGLAVEPRPAGALADDMARDGLVVEAVGPCRVHRGRAVACVPTASEDLVETVITMPRQSPLAGDRYDLGWLFTCWLWESGLGDWNRGVRALARTLRGLERIGLIERRTLRRPGTLTHHGFVLTDAGQEAVTALSGDWIEEDHR